MKSNKLYKEVLVNVLSKEEVNVTFPQLSDSMDKIVELNVINMLEQIVGIIREEDLSDVDCFNKIEEIVCLLEKNGISGGLRHDL